MNEDYGYTPTDAAAPPEFEFDEQGQGVLFPGDLKNKALHELGEALTEYNEGRQSWESVELTFLRAWDKAYHLGRLAGQEAAC